jgi:glycosyltransferase involved in cell wall biosynthesis
MSAPVQGHIVFLSSAHPPEDKRVFAKQAITLAEAGYRVTHVCPHPGEGADSYEKSGVRIVTYRRGRRILQRALGVFALARRGLAEKPDALHCNEVDSWVSGLVAKLASRGRVRVVFDVHEHYPSTFAESRFPPALRSAVAATLRMLFRALTPFTSRIVFAKRTVAPDFPARYWPGAGARGVLVQNFSPRAGLPAVPAVAREAAAPLTLIHVGLISRLRGWPQLLEAMARLAVPPHLRVIGTFNDGSEPEFLAEAERLGLRERIRHDAWMPFDTMMEACAAADIGLVLFQPGTQNHVFASPHKLFDYWLAGLPVIAPDFAVEVQAFMQDAGGGLLVDPADPEAIAAAITQLADPARRAALGQAGRAAVLDRYNWETEAAKLLAMYRALLPA